MSAPLKDKECIIAMYDSYAKTVMRNKCRNALRAKRRRQRYEIVGAEKIQYLFEMQSPDRPIRMKARSPFRCVVGRFLRQRLYVSKPR